MGQIGLDIVRLYDSNLVNLFSINQIARLLGKKYPFVNKKVTQLIAASVLKKTVVGKSHLCSLNFESQEAVSMLCRLEAEKGQNAKFPKHLKRFIDSSLLRICIHCVVQSHGKLTFVIESLRDRREIERGFPGSRVIDKQEFIDILAEGDGLFTQHIVLYGCERFFELLRPALDELKKKHSPVRY